MTADYPVYARLAPLLPQATVVDFVPQRDGESLVDYAARMAERFSAGGLIGGVSFGGIVALEIAKLIRPKGCVLISSVRDPLQLPPWFRIWRTFGGRRCETWLKWIGAASALVPSSIRTHSTWRATKLAGDQGRWHRWATASVLDWRPTVGPMNVPILQIHGTADATFPIRYVAADVVVPRGSHALPISHPKETAAAIEAFERSLG